MYDAPCAVQVADSNRELKAQVASLQLAVSRGEEEISRLRSTRELDPHNLRMAADAALKWQLQEVEARRHELERALSVRESELVNAKDAIQSQAQALLQVPAAAALEGVACSCV